MTLPSPSIVQDEAPSLQWGSRSFTKNKNIWSRKGPQVGRQEQRPSNQQRNLPQKATIPVFAIRSCRLGGWTSVASSVFAIGCCPLFPDLPCVGAREISSWVLPYISSFPGSGLFMKYKWSTRGTSTTSIVRNENKNDQQPMRGSHFTFPMGLSSDWSFDLRSGRKEAF